MSLLNKRVFWIVADSLGVGFLPDAHLFKPVKGGDVGANTLYNIIESTGGLNAPALKRMGFAHTLIDSTHAEGHRLYRPDTQPIASYGRMAEVSAGKDTPSGHWELAGCPVPYQMPVYYDGLPTEMLERFIARCHESGNAIPGVLGGEPASGTEIIARLGEEHVRTLKPIVYTSGDSVFQIAAHEGVFGLDRLYLICGIARKMLNEYEDKIGRVIARPFVGESSATFTRTPNRRDYSLKPLKPTVLNAARDAGLDIISIGKIADIFADEGITEKIKSKSNTQSMEVLTELALKKGWCGIAFANLTDFDMLYGHRRDPAGYREAIERLDGQIPGLLDKLTDNDLVIITADHGCDPTFAGTDHTREYVPVLVYQKQRPPKNLGTRGTFADCAASLVSFLDLDYQVQAESFL
ncbi:MAG: phosphopentomutase [Deltaproteobacteria bacterium]|nr:phosphopentomutase [Deltaproteobacteria bacterium]